jgi:hypothetical protein
MPRPQRAAPSYGRRPGPPANDHAPVRRVVVDLPSTAPITQTEVEVFDLLIDRFDLFAANDNEAPNPHPTAIRGPPMDKVL